MSGLIDRLEQIGRDSPQPIGFGAASRASKNPAMAIVANISSRHTQSAKLAVELQLDAAILSGRIASRTLSTVTKAFGDGIPWGAGAPPADGDEAAKLTDAGCDFFVSAADALSLEAAMSPDVASLLDLESSLPDDATLRALKALPVVALVIDLGDTGQPLTIADIMPVASIAAATDKPALVRVPAAITQRELEALRDAGASAVIVNVSAANKANIARIREDLLSLPRKSSRRGSDNSHGGLGAGFGATAASALHTDANEWASDSCGPNGDAP